MRNKTGFCLVCYLKRALVTGNILLVIVSFRMLFTQEILESVFELIWTIKDVAGV